MPKCYILTVSNYFHCSEFGFTFPLIQLFIDTFKILIFLSLLRWIFFKFCMSSQEKKIIAA